MEDGLCPIELALTEIESSSRSQSDINQGLLVLKRIVTNLLAQPHEEKFKIISRKNEVLAKQLFILDGVSEFLKIIGFEEKDGLFRHSGGDEKMKLLEAALKSLNFHLKNQEQTPCFGQRNNRNSVKSMEREKDRDNGFFRDFSKPKSAECQFKVQNRENQSVNNEKAEYSFNSEGYFHQSLNKNEKKKVKNIQDLFDKHDITDKKAGSFFSFLKLG